MRDLVHEFAKTVLNNERCYWESYLALESFEDTVKEISPSLRTLVLERRGISGDILSKLECLHVLKLTEIDVLPACIGKLKHLRYLDISISRIENLPDSFYKLYNLQTLRIDDRNLNGFPERVSNLISLSRIHCNGEFKESQMPLGLGLLTCLITLKLFNVSKEKGRRIEELGNLKNLKGSLHIRNIQLVNGEEEAKLANFCEKPNLAWLKFEWSGDHDFGGDDDVLEGLQPNPNLRILKIQNFTGCRFPYWFMNLSALKGLALIGCKRCIQLPALGQLPSLQHLRCRELEEIRRIGQSFYGNLSSVDRRFFPALKYLSLNRLRNLVEWKDADEEVVSFPVLKKLEIQDCRYLTTAPVSNFSSIRHLYMKGGCQVSPVEKILSSSILTPSSLELQGDQYMRDALPISSLRLKKRGGSNSEEDGFAFNLWLQVVEGIPSSEITLVCLLNRYINSSSFQRLKVSGFRELTSLRGIGFDVGRTSLQSLELLFCSNLGTEDVFEFQSLRYLEVVHCPKFDLEIPRNNNEGQRCLLTSLEELRIEECDGLSSLPVEMLEACNKSLQRLQVKDCPNLVSFPLGYLTSLDELELRCDSTKFDWSGLISLSALRKLSLIDSFHAKADHAESLPHQLQCLTSLTELKLQSFSIKALPYWIGNLAALENLKLWSCPKLQYLPSIAAMRALTKLTSLKVIDCPLLKNRCISGPKFLIFLKF